MDLSGYDLVLRSPSLAPYKIKTDGKIWSATNEFFDKCKAPIIGVTGSKGKGTICSLIAAILKAADKKVFLVGNIGVPALDKLSEITSDDVVVYEMSSFQLWDLVKSPQVAVVGMVEADHLNVHKDINEYILAKANITAYQKNSDLFVYKANNEYTAIIAAKSKAGKKIAYQSETSAHVENSSFYYGQTEICPISSLNLPGEHNLDNACAAIDATYEFISDPAVIAKGLSSFYGLPHRLRFVKKFKDVEYYDDSIATTPGSAIAALRAFSSPKIIILGGSPKGADFNELAKVAKNNNLKLALTIGAEGKRIADIFKKNDLPIKELGMTISMDKIVKIASSKAEPGDIVILSPACASFGMFKNYADRGDQFINSVNGLR